MGTEGLPEGPEGLSEGCERLSEGSEGVPEGPEGLQRVLRACQKPRGGRTDGHMYVRTDGQTDGQNFSLFYRT